MLLKRFRLPEDEVAKILSENEETLQRFHDNGVSIYKAADTFASPLF